MRDSTSADDVQAVKNRHAIAAAVIVSNGRVLLVRRRVQEGRLSWQFPAGKVELGESES
jgi:8-oxo-dGTP diphosphatase